MTTRVGLAVLLALAAAGGCTKQTAGTSGETPGMASTTESTLMQEAAPATTANAPSEPQMITMSESVPAAAPVAPMETAAAPAGSAPIGSPREIQQALKQAGFYQGNIDGKVGPMTQQAIKEFQQANQLKVDGKVGPRTWAALQPYLATESSTQ